MDFGSDDANDGWAEVGSHTFGDDVGNGLRFANSGALELDDLDESGSDEEDYIVKVRPQSPQLSQQPFVTRLRISSRYFQKYSTEE